VAVSETWTTLKVLDWTSQRFGQAGFESARLEAQVLLAHVLGCNRVALYTRFDQPLHPDELVAFRELIKRRLASEPLAYLVGEQEFWSLPFRVDARVLIPRRDTETLIEVVLDETPDRKAAVRVIDVATGSGAVGITLERELPAATVIATDVSAAALALAAENAEHNGVAQRVTMRQGDLLEPLAGETADILVANLPYIPTEEVGKLPGDVQREPHLALDGGADGLDLIRRLVGDAPPILAPGGLLALEHGFDQAPAVAEIIAASGHFTEARLRKDLGKQPRVTFARRL
jgi:release factor glutamine methyltransferase